MPRVTHPWFLAALAAITLSAPENSSAQGLYRITDLGTLPGATESVAAGLNEAGDVVGYSDTGAGTDQVAVVWRGGVIASLGKLPKGNSSRAAAINAGGVVVGEGDGGDYRPLAWVTRAGALYNFFSNNGGNTHTIAINDAGGIGGYYTKSLSGNVSAWRGAIWTPDPKDPRKYRQVDLPILVGPDPTFKGTTAVPAAFNRSGQAAGYATNEVIGQHACFWDDDADHSITDLGVFPGDWSSLAWGLNNLGQVVGESHPPAGSRPVLWMDDADHTPIELPLLPGDNYGSAAAINDLGQILGTSAASEPGTWNVGPARLVIWRDGEVFELGSLLDASGAGWELTIASAINGSGQIVGAGYHNGQFRAFLMTPVGP